MEIEMARGGGFAGPALHQRLGPVNTDRAKNGAEIETLIDRIGFFALPEKFPNDPSRKNSDPMWHSATVTASDETQTVEWDDNSQRPPSALTHELPALMEMAGASWT